jgi:mannose-6-phosphate isomerase
MGAHPAAPTPIGGCGETLAALIERDPVAALGPEVAERSAGKLPYLLKVLAAGRPLSLQAHPGAQQALAGFAREEAAGLAADDPRRTYRDPHHKPELVCAVSGFEARCGFRSRATTVALLDELGQPALGELRRRLTADGADREVLAETLRWLLSRPADDARRLVAAAAAPGPGSGRFAAERASTRRLAEAHPADPGVVVALLLHHVRLEPGQALFLGPGNLHCYLGGMAVEVMANSDNVVRGGLTAKHVDVDELVATVDAEPLDSPVQRPAGPVHTYHSPVPEFRLTRLEVDGPLERPAAARILLVLDGVVTAGPAGGDRVELGAGHSAWSGWSDGPVVVSGRGLAYEAIPGPAR